MVTIVAGMESDLTDSENEMVFTVSDERDGKETKKRNSNLDFRPIPKKLIPNGTFKPVLEEGNNKSQYHDLQKDHPTSHHSTKSKDKWSRRSVSQKSQPLDDLRYAVMEGNLEVTKDILSKGIHVQSILKAGWTALMYAASCARHEIVLYLLENGADPNYHKDMFTALMATCASTKDEEDLYKCCCHLLKHGAKVNVYERHSTTPLMFASREGHFQIVKKLLEAGAEVNARDTKSQTTLFWAASEGHGQIVHLLLSKGADPNAVDFGGQTAADVAYSQGFKEVAAVLERSASKQNTAPNDLITEDSQKQMPKAKRELVKSLRAAPGPSKNQKYVEKQGELEMFLNGLGLSNLVAIFNKNHLGFTDLLIMDEEELEKIGIAELGIRKAILGALKTEHKKEWQNSSLQNLRQLQYISCPDAVAMMANIAKHLRYISTTVVYMRQQIQSQPRILELAQDTANVHDLIDEMDDTLKNLRSLSDEVRFFKLHLNKVQGNVKYIPADMIVETMPSEQAVNRTIIFWSIVVSVTIGGILWKKPSGLQYLGSLVVSKVPFLRR